MCEILLYVSIKKPRLAGYTLTRQKQVKFTYVSIIVTESFPESMGQEVNES